MPYAHKYANAVTELGILGMEVSELLYVSNNVYIGRQIDMANPHVLVVSDNALETVYFEPFLRSKQGFLRSKKSFPLFNKNRSLKTRSFY